MSPQCWQTHSTLHTPDSAQSAVCPVCTVSCENVRVRPGRRGPADQLYFPSLLSKFSWCSGYHICLTHRRSPVRSRAKTLQCFYVFQFRDISTHTFVSRWKEIKQEINQIKIQIYYIISKQRSKIMFYGVYLYVLPILPINTIFYNNYMFKIFCVWFLQLAMVVVTPRKESVIVPECQIVRAQSERTSLQHGPGPGITQPGQL